MAFAERERTHPGIRRLAGRLVVCVVLGGEVVGGSRYSGRHAHIH
jgi:hypothetical protein